MVECKKYFLVKLNDTWMPKSEHARAGVLMNAFLLTVVRGWGESGVYKTKIMYPVVPNCQNIDRIRDHMTISGVY